MDLGQIRNLMNLITHKENGQYISPDDFQNAINTAQLLEFQSLLPSAMIKSKTGAYEENSQVMTVLQPFKKPSDLLVDINGQANYPVGFQYPSSASREIIVTNKCANDGGPITSLAPIRLLNDDSVSKVISSRIIGPSYKRGYYAMYDSYMQFWPKDIQVVKFTYLRKPNDIVYAYTISNNREVYDATHSVQLEWREIRHNQIIIRALQYIGINIGEPQLINFVNQFQSQI